MTRKKIVIWFIPILIIAGALCAYISYTFFSPDYVKFLPKNLKVITAVDLKKLTAASDFAPEALLINGLAIYEVDKVGIEWAQPIYGFLTNENELGLLLPVDDKDDVTNALQKLVEKGHCKEVTKRDEVHWTVYKGRWIVAYNDDAVLVMETESGLEDNKKRQIQKLFAQSFEESGANTVLFEKAKDATSPVCISANAELISFLKPYMALTQLPGHTNLRDIYLTANLFYEDNKVIAKCEVSSPNEQLNEKLGKVFKNGRTLKETYVDCVPNDAMVWSCVNIDGDELLKVLRKDPVIRTALLGINMCVDADMMIKSIDGDVAYTLKDIDEEGNKDYIVRSQIENDDFLSEASYWLESANMLGIMSLNRIDEKQFYWTMDDHKGCFGVCDSSLCLASNNINDYQCVTNEASALAKWKKEINGKGFFLWMNWEQLLANQYVLKEWQIHKIPMLLKKGVMRETVVYFTADRHLDIVFKLDDDWRTKIGL